MTLKIDDNYINTQYKYKQNKNSVIKETSFVNLLNDSKRKLYVENNNISNGPIYSKSGMLENIVDTTTKSSNNYSSEKIEKRIEDIHELQKEYDGYTEKYGPEGTQNGWGKKLNPKIMEKVLDLQVESNKDIYYNNGKININKVAEDCGIPLNNITPLEVQSLREELKDEGLIDERTSDALEFFVSRACSDIAHINGCYDVASIIKEEFNAYNNIRFNVSERANYYKKEDIEYNLDQTIKNLDDIILDLIRN